MGRLFTRDLTRLANTSDPTAATDELVAVGFWTQLPDGWQIEHQMDLQVESEVIMARRKANAERQRRKRLKAAGLPDRIPKVCPCHGVTTRVTCPVTTRVTCPVTTRVILVWVGLDRTALEKKYLRPPLKERFARRCIRGITPA